MLAAGRVVLDPSRVAAQVVSGIGFIGGGLIFVRRAPVPGLTTAAGIWLSAAVGMAAGAGMWIEAVAGTLLGLAVVDGMERLERILPSGKSSVSAVRVTYVERDGALHAITGACTSHGSDIRDVVISRSNGDPPTAGVRILLRRPRQRAEVVRALSEVDGGIEVATGRGRRSGVGVAGRRPGELCRAYSPRHSGRRLARKASIPSLKSADM